MLKGLSPDCSSPGNTALWQREEGRNGVDSQALFVPAASGQEGEQEASVPLGRLCPFPPCWCYLGLPRSCLKTSGSGELSEGAGGRNRRVHMLKPWLECLETLAHTQAQGQGA